MIQIYIDNKLIDLDNTNISLQKEFTDDVENIPTEIEYSYSISIPSTLNNKEVFGFVDTFDVGNKFARVYNAELYVDESLILSGKFKMTSIEDGKFKGNIYNPKKKTVSDILGDRNLNEIKPHLKPMNSLSDFDATNNFICRLNSSEERLSGITVWEDVEGVVDNHVVYPYILYGLPMNVAEENLDLDIYTQNLEYGKHNISENNVFPAFNVLSVLKDIFATEGYNLVGNIFESVNGSYFNNLYQSFQYSYDDYVKNKEVPFFCKFKGEYSNFVVTKAGSTDVSSGEISSSLELVDINGYSQESYTVGDKYQSQVPSTIQYGVDSPFQCGGLNNTFKDIEDEKHMLARGSTDKNTGVIIIPKSGWYKIKCTGNMKYPYKGNAHWSQTNRENVGGCLDEADNTDLSEQPFEFQIKKGMPKENPKFYSYNSLMPCVPTDFSEQYNYTVTYDCYDTYLRWGENDKQRYYGKNGGVTYVNNYSNYSTSDFVCGVRLGDAWFNGRDEWNKAHRGPLRRPNRFVQFGAGMVLPDVTKVPQYKIFDDVPSQCQGGREDSTAYNQNGKYFKLSDKNNTLSYGYRTAQVLVRHSATPQQSSFSNFYGYNQLKETGWDTTTNYGRITFDGAEDSAAVGIDKYSGQWNINTVVWLEEGDTLYAEVLIPCHFKRDWVEPDSSTSSEWENAVEWVNVTNINYEIEIGFLNSRSDWKPKPGDGINSWEDISTKKLTNVNKFLPNSIKCNDYLEKFLKTFNLQLTMVNENTFSIDSNVNMNLSTNIIDIDGMVDASDAEFKPLSSDSAKQLCWKNDLSETGYAQGNQSPYLSQELVYPWDNSGYTGNYTITNETNTNGSIKKIESQWSYNWYKTIRFINSKYWSHGIETYDPVTKMYFGELEIPVISDQDRWMEGSSFFAFSDEKPQTSKTSRLFFIDTEFGEKIPHNNFIEFIYNKVGEGKDEKTLWCNLVIPENSTARHDHDEFYKLCFLTYDKESLTAPAYITITDMFFNQDINGGYQIDVPIKLTNQQYADVKQGTLFKLNDGLYKIKSIEGHDVNMEDDATLSLLTIK